MYALALWLLLAGTPLLAQTVVTSPAPTAVAVTLYRDPARAAGTPIDLQALSGFALISETREVDLPPGVVTIRFEGVASGIEPVSALVFGVPISEKNRERRLLSQRGLLDAFTGQAVIMRRMDRATGKVSEEPGTIRSAPDGLILQTRSGYEAIYCTGLDQTLLFPRLPTDLTAKPTLSVTTRDQPGGRQTLTLTYLAGHFDWQANYVGELSADARHVDLLGWMTMASGDTTTFIDANAYAVAGQLSKVHDAQNDAQENTRPADDSALGYACWPSGTTSSGSALRRDLPPAFDMPAPMMMRSAMAPMEMSMDKIMVAASKRAEREDLGDLKLYRIPFAVTVAAQSQKQVAFLTKPTVQGEVIYRSQFDATFFSAAVELVYRLQNDRQSGLGEALPAGQVTLFQTTAGRRMLVGEAPLSDKAVGEEVELPFTSASNVAVSVKDNDKLGGKQGDQWTGKQLSVTNANPYPITYEAEFHSGDAQLRHEKFSQRVFARKGKKVWRVIVPANGERKLEFRLVNAGYRATS